MASHVTIDTNGKINPILMASNQPSRPIGATENESSFLTPDSPLERFTGGINPVYLTYDNPSDSTGRFDTSLMTSDNPSEPRGNVNLSLITCNHQISEDHHPAATASLDESHDDSHSPPREISEAGETAEGYSEGEVDHLPRIKFEHCFEVIDDPVSAAVQPLRTK